MFQQIKNLFIAIGISFIYAFILAIPLWFIWNHLAETYFYWLPKVYHFVPFWHMVGLVMLVSILKPVLLPEKFNATK